MASTKICISGGIVVECQGCTALLHRVGHVIFAAPYQLAATKRLTHINFVITIFHYLALRENYHLTDCRILTLDKESVISEAGQHLAAAYGEFVWRTVELFGINKLRPNVTVSMIVGKLYHGTAADI